MKQGGLRRGREINTNLRADVNQLFLFNFCSGRETRSAKHSAAARVCEGARARTRDAMLPIERRDFSLREKLVDFRDLILILMLKHRWLIVIAFSVSRISTVSIRSDPFN